MVPGSKHRDARAAVVQSLGRYSLFLFALTAWLSTSLSTIGLSLAVLSVLFDAEARRTLARHPAFLATAAFGTYVLVRTSWAIVELPELAGAQLRNGVSWFRLALFLCIGWLMWRERERLNVVLSVAFIGFLIGILTHLDFAALGAMLRGELRTGFHLQIETMALIAVVAILGFLVLGSRWMRTTSSRVPRALRVGIVGLSVLILAEILLIGQARAAWLALLVVYPPVLYLHYMRGQSGRIARGHLALILAPFVLVVAMNWDIIEQRWGAERETLHAVMGDRLSEAPPTSGALRLQLYRFALEKWSERPMIGWGPGTVHYLLERSHVAVFQEEGLWRVLSHLHSVYSELLVRFGLIGAALAFLVVGVLVGGVWRGYREGAVPRDQMLMVAGAFAISAVVGFFGIRVTHPDGFAYWLLLAGTAFALTLSSKAGGGTAARTGEPQG